MRTSIALVFDPQIVLDTEDSLVRHYFDRRGQLTLSEHTQRLAPMLHWQPDCLAVPVQELVWLHHRRMLR